MAMKTSFNGFKFIEQQEGCVLHVYNDIAGNPSIGIGHKLLPGESYPNGITQEQAMDLLRADVVKIEGPLLLLIPPYVCTQNQFDACISFGFNEGVGGLKTMLSHGWDMVPVEMLRWIYSDGEKVEDLVRRRAAEVALWQAP